MGTHGTNVAIELLDEHLLDLSLLCSGGCSACCSLHVDVRLEVAPEPTATTLELTLNSADELQLWR